MLRMGPLLVAILLSVAPADVDAAFADLAKLPQERQYSTAYLSLSDVPSEEQAALEAVTKVVVCSLSHKSHLPSQLPVRVQGTTLLRLDLYSLGWQPSYHAVLTRHYPYRPDLSKVSKYPLVASALWFATQVSDPVEAPGAQDLLLYGKELKKLDEVLAFWKAGSDQDLFFGFLEGKSGVSVKRARTIENRPSGNRGYVWGTKDFEKFDLTSDPLENLKPGSTRFDASEWIIGIPKSESGRLGMLNSYALADAKGNLQAKAPASIVVDHQQLRGVEIRNWVSCIGCHTTGLIDTTADEYRQYLTAGASISSYDKATKLAIESYLETDIAGELKRNRELYALGIEMTCGLKPEAFSKAFVAAVKAYDADVTLQQAAREIGCTAEDLKLAIAWQSAKGVNVGARLAQLPHGVAVPRDRFEELAYVADSYVKAWRASK